jgi:mono/diheme cytochrome c family protein
LSRRDLVRARARAVFVALLMGASFGCWEQIDDGKWFPQMKRQPTIQAFELVKYQDQGQGFSPPEGTVPIGWEAVPELASLTVAQRDALRNPIPANLASLARGAELFTRYCVACHGKNGGGNGTVAGPPFGTGPLGFVWPIAGPASMVKALSEGHMYTTISMGSVNGRMPSYQRIEPEDRWNVVNYIRDLNGLGGRQ